MPKWEKRKDQHNNIHTVHICVCSLSLNHYGMVWYALVCYGMVRYGTAQHGTARHGMAGHPVCLTIQFKTIWKMMVWGNFSTCWSTATASSPLYIILTQPSLEARTKSDIKAWNIWDCHIVLCIYLHFKCTVSSPTPPHSVSIKKTYKDANEFWVNLLCI